MSPRSVICWLCIVSSIPLMAVEHDPLPIDPQSTAGAVISGGSATPVLRLEQPTTVRLLRRHPIDIQGLVHVVVGECRYDLAGAGAYLEMWSHLEDGRAFFSRTLADSGPMERLQGESDWRSFTLPAHNEQDFPPVTHIDLSLVAAGTGTVALREIRLQQPSAAGGTQTITGMSLLWGSVGIVLGFVVASWIKRRRRHSDRRAMMAADYEP